MEDDRKEEERKKNIPYLMLANGSVTPNIARITETNISLSYVRAIQGAAKNITTYKTPDITKLKNKIKWGRGLLPPIKIKKEKTHE